MTNYIRFNKGDRLLFKKAACPLLINCAIIRAVKTLLLTNEYPPHIYGGAGVHVDYLTRELSKLCDVDVRCYGEQRLKKGKLQVTGFPDSLRSSNISQSLKIGFGTVQRGLDFNLQKIDADLVHCHTWYAHFGGILAKLNHSIPLVITVHSLEPLRPWKREQLGGGYDFSCWVERTALEMADAIIAVSEETRKDILRLFNVSPEKVHVIYNGIDTQEYRRVRDPERVKRCGVNPSKPFVLFVGRITRQKGILHLVNAIRYLDPGFQVVLCAGSPDTPEIAREMECAITEVKKDRPGVIWIQEVLPVPDKVALYSHASLFCCPSIYEPFGIINLEAMACEIPVVASRVGGIPEVVEHQKTGLLVKVAQKKSSPFEPLDPGKFSKDLARQINYLMVHPDLSRKMGQAGRKRAMAFFSWKSIARQTLSLYRSLLD